MREETTGDGIIYSEDFQLMTYTTIRARLQVVA